MSDTQVTWLTQEAYGRLKQELDELIENRPVIAAKINTSREEGDLKENGGYHAAREEQGQQGGADPPPAGAAAQRQGRRGAPRTTGSRSRARCSRSGTRATTRTEKFLLATREEGAEGELEVYSPESPLGKALLGAKEGETRSYELPNGSTQKVTLVKAVPYAG